MGIYVPYKRMEIFRTSDSSTFTKELEDFKKTVHIGQILTIKKKKKVVNEKGKVVNVTMTHPYMIVDKTDNFVVCQSIKSRNAPYKECFLWIDAFNTCMGNDDEDEENSFDE